MNYRQQEKFFEIYAKVGVAILAVSIANTFVLLNLHRPNISTTRSLIYTGLTCLLSYAIYYLPKYLIFTIEKYKKLNWTIRIRWILSVAFLIFGLATNSSTQGFVTIIGATVFLIFTNWIVRVLSKSKSFENKSNQLNFYPLIYIFVDSLIISFLLWKNIFSVEICLVMMALALHIFVLLIDEAWLTFSPIIFLCGNLILWKFGGDGPSCGVLALWFTSSLGLIWLTHKQHQKNLEETIDSLIHFTGKDSEQIQNLLLTSTGKLAGNWNAAPPKTPQEVQAWYIENAKYYLYDLSQFHLSYKHIEFSIDVINCSQGNVLDYGGGIGDLSLAMASNENLDVTYFDVEGESQDYARWCALERGLRLKFATNQNELEGPYDTIILLDVLEHLADPEETLEFLLQKLAPNGLIIASIAFGATKAHPMHFDHKLDVPKWLKARGLKDKKSLQLKLFGSESMRRPGVIIYQLS